MSSSDPFSLAQQAVAAIEVGAGAEKYRYGRETMRDDAISAIGALQGPGWADDLRRSWHIANLEAYLDLPVEDQRWIAVERPDLAKRLRSALLPEGVEW